MLLHRTWVPRICIACDRGFCAPRQYLSKSRYELCSRLCVGKLNAQRMQSSRKPHFVFPKQSSLDVEYFHIVKHPSQAYILGLLTADGWITDRGQLGFSVINEDRELVETIRAEIAPTASINVREYEGKRRPMAEMRVQTPPNVRIDLARYGIVPRKTHTLIWPEVLPVTLARSYILGLFDGDGSVGVYPQRNGTPHPQWSLAGTLMMLRGALLAIKNGTGILLAEPHLIGGTTHVISATSANAIVINEWLHQDGLGLHRKAAAFDSLGDLTTYVVSRTVCTCPVCGTTYPRRSSTDTYCSPRCRQSIYYAHWLAIPENRAKRSERDRRHYAANIEREREKCRERAKRQRARNIPIQLQA